YGLDPTSPDEAVTRDVLLGRQTGERLPDALLVVVDASNLDNHLRFTLQLIALGLPIVVALNMVDLAERDGLKLDPEALERELGVPVVPTVAVRKRGLDALRERLSEVVREGGTRIEKGAGVQHDIVVLQRRARQIALAATVSETAGRRWTHRLDAVALHPIAGPVLLLGLLFVMFQAVFAWSEAPIGWIETLMGWLSDAVSGALPAGFVRSFLVDGLIAGVGAVVVFLPQILILFTFILALEDSGYLPRAAFLLDNLMGKVGLSGRAFIPLLSSFACAIPGIMATRTIANPRDRLATIMLSPLMTCSARLPVYALIIGAFIPARAIGPFNLRGLTLFGLYLAGVLSALGVGYVMKRLWLKNSQQSLMMELPPYRLPSLSGLAIGLLERTRIFLRRVGTIIFSLMVLLWFLSSWPGPPPGAVEPPIYYSIAGQIGRGLQHVFAPIGFNWQISVALVPGLAAREVAVGALGTVYALSAGGDSVADSLSPLIAQGWSLATAFSLLAWYVFAPQCLSTLAVVRRETNSWRYPVLMAAYLFGLAYAASFVTYRIALLLGAG
ncbi:MAG: ferrous iron transporter B, partial [Rubrivivax sp.]